MAAFRHLKTAQPLGGTPDAAPFERDDANKMTKKRGPGRPIGTTPRIDVLVGIYCQAEFLTTVDNWREQQEALLSRPAAIRRLAELGLRIEGTRISGANTTTTRPKNLKPASPFVP